MKKFIKALYAIKAAIFIFFGIVAAVFSIYVIDRFKGDSEKTKKLKRKTKRRMEENEKIIDDTAAWLDDNQPLKRL